MVRVARFPRRFLRWAGPPSSQRAEWILLPISRVHCDITQLLLLSRMYAVFVLVPARAASSAGIGAARAASGDTIADGRMLR